MLRGATVALVSSSGDRTVKVVDYETGTTFCSFADTAPAKGGLVGLAGPASIDGLGGGGDYIVTSQAKEHALVFHKWGKTQPVFKCKTSEALSPIVSTPDGLFVIGGGASGKVYVWEVATGSLIQTWEAHFKAVTSLAISQDGSMLISGSDDTLVRVWAMAQALDMEAAADGVRPLRSWSGHSLPVTSVFCGMGGTASRVVSVSLDQTAQIYDLLSTSALHTIRCQQGLTAVAMDAAERRLALGGVAGTVFMVDLDVVAMAKTAARAAAVIVGAKAVLGGTEGPAGEEVSVKQESLHELVGHNKAVTALSFSWDGKLLVSASEDGTLRTWDLESHQCIRRLCLETSGTVNAAVLIPRPRALTQPPTAKTVLAPLQPFKKHRVEGGASRPTSAQQQTEKGSTACAVAGDVVLVGGGRHRGAGLLLASSALSMPSSLLSLAPASKVLPTAETATEREAVNMEVDDAATVQSPSGKESNTVEVVAAKVAQGKNSSKKKRKGSMGGGVVAAGGAGGEGGTGDWEQARSQLEAEVERLKGENEQWKELSNHLWKRLGGEEEEDDSPQPQGDA